MRRKWKPNKAQRQAFKAKMQDTEQRKEYEARKALKAQNKRKSSQFDYDSAGGEYIPTKAQY